MDILRDVTLILKNDKYEGESTRSFAPTVESRLPVEMLFSSVTASSTLAAQTEPGTGVRFDYLPYHAIDQREDTIWAEGAAGNGVGEWLRIDFIHEINLSGMYIQNGYWRTEERLNQNCRVKRVKVSYSNGTSEEFELQDTAGIAYQNLIGSNGEHIIFSEIKTTSYVQLTILEVYPGSRWEDVCISGILLHR
jgi:hypothetical protein